MLKKKCKAFERKTEIRITPQTLREMGRLGVPKTVLARHYTDFSPEKLREIYDSLKVLS